MPQLKQYTTSPGVHNAVAFLSRLLLTLGGLNHPLTCRTVHSVLSRSNTSNSGLLNSVCHVDLRTIHERPICAACALSDRRTRSCHHKMQGIQANDPERTARG